VKTAARFVGQRLAFGLLVLIVIAYLSHFGLAMARGLAFGEALGIAVPKTMDSLRRVVTANLGMSPSASSDLNPLPVGQVLVDTLGKSLGLLVFSIAIAAVIGVTLGLWSARRGGSGWSLITILASIVGISVPSFFAALLLQIVVIRLSRGLGRPLLPVGGFGWDNHLILPALVLAARPVAQIARVTHIAISDVLTKDYVRTARSKGLAPRRVMMHHVWRNAAIPTITTIGLSLRFSLSSLPVVEYFFGWPGAGFTLLKAIAQQDDNLTVALLLALGVLFILINLVLDMLYRMIDPRVREDTLQQALGETPPLTQRVRSVLMSVMDWLRDSALVRFITRRKREPIDNPFREVLQERGDVEAWDATQARRLSRRVWLRSILFNVPFLLGALLVLGMGVTVVFGQDLAPHSPFTTRGLVVEEGEMSVPPFEPSVEFPWGTDVMGRDVMSLILTGAWQTMRLAGAVVIARLMVGFVLGTMAGWNRGGWLDRTVLGLAETVSAFPALLLAMTLILALGIRKGFMPFVVALCFVGWGEVMQYIRSEVVAMRPKTFIENAVAVGQRTSGIIVKHVLPNLVPALISITALEMGAVLMLLGELGFVGIFIGGGAFAELAIDMPLYHYSDIPEWGALLSNVRDYARSYPWTAIYPALAFFVAILGFNLFGEGIRRLVDDVGVHITRLVNRYTLTLGVVALAALTWFRGATGATGIYRDQAQTFDGQRAMQDVAALTAPAVEGRSLGTVGLGVASEWIAERFKTLDLQAAGEDFTYFQVRPRSYEVLDSVPCFAIDDGGPAPVYLKDYTAFPARARNLGRAVGPVRVITFGELTQSMFFGQYFAVEDLDFTGEVLMVFSPMDVRYLEDVPKVGVLVVAEDPNAVRRNYTLSSIDPRYRMFGTDRVIGQDTPVLMISEAMADRILRGTGTSVSELRIRIDDLIQDERLEIPTETQVALEVEGSIFEKGETRHVIAHLPGTSGLGATKMDQQLILVMAKYDSPPPIPREGPTPAAIDNASGLAVMLEAIRAMQQSGYQPYRTFLFVAYSGEGLEYGNQVSKPEISKLLETKFGFSEAFEVEAVIDIRGIGTQTGEELIIGTGGSARLGTLFEESARRLGVPARRADEGLDISIVFGSGSRRESGQEAPSVTIRWEGWEWYSQTMRDTPAAISVEHLEQAGEVVTLSLMVLGREVQY
jgi:peptide/nickel transport system permease protein